MQQLLPNPDVHVSYTHSFFDELLKPFVDGLKVLRPSGNFVVEAIAYGSRGRSDIKWNDYAGTFRMQIKDTASENAPSVGNLVSCNLVHFTGNCGVKAISHINLAPAWGTAPTNEAIRKQGLKGNVRYKEYVELLKVVESFAYHKLNCGWLLGSDTFAAYKGRTIQIVEEVGQNYHVSDKTWNPNYTWSRDHTIAFFYKDLNKAEHVDYWASEKKLEMPKGTAEASVK